jgi:hypothetical protein
MLNDILKTPDSLIYFRLRKVNILGLFTIYLIATNFGHMTIFK